MPTIDDYNQQIDSILSAVERFLRGDLFKFLKISNSQQCLEPYQKKLHNLKQTIDKLQQAIVDTNPVDQDTRQDHTSPAETDRQGVLAYVDELTICHSVVDSLIAIADTQQLFHGYDYRIDKETQLIELQTCFKTLLETIAHHCQFDKPDCITEWKYIVQKEYCQQVILFLLFYDWLHTPEHDEDLYNQLVHLIVENDQLPDPNRSDLTDEDQACAQRYHDFKAIVAYLYYLQTGQVVNGYDAFVSFELNLQSMGIGSQNSPQSGTDFVAQVQQKNKELGNNAALPTYLKKYLQSRMLLRGALIIINQPHSDKSCLSLLMALLQVDFSSELGQPFDTQIMTELFKVFANHVFLQNTVNVFRYPGYLALTERQTLAIDELVSFYHKTQPSQIPQEGVQTLLTQLDQTMGMVIARDNIFKDSAHIEASHCLNLIKQQINPLLAIWDQKAAAYIDWVIYLYTTAADNTTENKEWLSESADQARQLPNLQVQNLKNFFIATLPEAKRAIGIYFERGVSRLKYYYPANSHTVQDDAIFNSIHCMCQAIYIIDRFLEINLYRSIDSHYSHHRQAYLVSETSPVLSDNEKLIKSLVKTKNMPNIFVGFNPDWLKDIEAVLAKNNDLSGRLDETEACVVAMYNSLLICFQASCILNRACDNIQFVIFQDNYHALNEQLDELEYSFKALGFGQQTLSPAGEYLVLSEAGQQVLLCFLVLDAIQQRPFLSKQMGADIAYHLYHSLLDECLKDVVDYCYYKRTCQQLNTLGYIANCDMQLSHLAQNTNNTKSDDWLLLVLNKACCKSESSVPAYLGRLINQTLILRACDQIMKNAADESQRAALLKKLGQKAPLIFQDYLLKKDQDAFFESDYIVNLCRILTMLKDWFDLHYKLNMSTNVMATGYLITQPLDLIPTIARQLVAVQMNQRSQKTAKANIHALRSNLVNQWLKEMNGKIDHFMKVDAYKKTDPTSLSDKELAILVKVISPLVDLMCINDQPNIVTLCADLHQAYRTFCTHGRLQFDTSVYRLDKTMMISLARSIPAVMDYCLQFIKTRLSAWYDKLPAESQYDDQQQALITIYNLCESGFAQVGLSLNLDDQMHNLRHRLGGFGINDPVAAELSDHNHSVDSNQASKPSKSKKKRNKRRRNKAASSNLPSSSTTQTVDQFAYEQFKETAAHLENDICVFLKQKLGSRLTMLELSQLEQDSQSMLTRTHNLMSQGDHLFDKMNASDVPESYNVPPLYNDFFQFLSQIAQLKQAYVSDHPHKIAIHHQAVNDQITAVTAQLQQYYQLNNHWRYVIDSQVGQSIITFVMFCELFHTSHYLQADMRQNLIDALNASTTPDAVKTIIGYLAYQDDELTMDSKNNPIVQCEQFLDDLQQSRLEANSDIKSKLDDYLRSALISDKSSVPGYLRYVVNSQLLGYAVLSIIQRYPVKSENLPLLEQLGRVKQHINWSPAAGNYIQVSAICLAQMATLTTTMNLFHNPLCVQAHFHINDLQIVQNTFKSNSWKKPSQFREAFAKVIGELDNSYHIIQQTRRAYNDHDVDQSLAHQASQLLQTCLEPLLALQHPRFLNIKRLITVLETAAEHTDQQEGNMLSYISAEDYKLPPEDKANTIFGKYLKNLARDWLEQLTPVLNKLVASCANYVVNELEEVHERLVLLNTINNLAGLLRQSPQISAQLARDSWLINQLVQDYQQYYDRLFDQQSSQQADCVSSAETASSSLTNNDTSNPALTIDNCLPDAVWQLVKDVQQFEREHGLKGWLVLTGGLLTALSLGRAIDDNDDYDLVWLVPDEHKQDPQYYLRRLGRFFWRKEMEHYAAPAMPKSPYHPVLKIKTQGNSTCYFDISCELVEPTYDNNVEQDSERFRQALAECLLRRDIRICTMVLDLTHSSPDDKTLTVIDEVGASLDVQRKEITLIGGCSPDNIQAQLTDDPGRLIRMAKLKLKYEDYGLKLNEDLALNLQVVVTPQFWDYVGDDHLSTAQGRLGTQLQKLMVSFSTHQVMQLLMEDEQLGGFLPKLAGIELSKEYRRQLRQLWSQYIYNNVDCQADDQRYSLKLCLYHCLAGLRFSHDPQAGSDNQYFFTIVKRGDQQYFRFIDACIKRGEATMAGDKLDQDTQEKLQDLVRQTRAIVCNRAVALSTYGSFASSITSSDPSSAAVNRPTIARLGSEF